MFGSKFLQTLSPLEVDVPVPSQPSDCDGGAFSSAADIDVGGEVSRAGSEVVKISGYVSKAGMGVGRSDNDRQFIFCNGRPVDLPKVTRIMNEVYNLKCNRLTLTQKGVDRINL